MRVAGLLGTTLAVALSIGATAEVTQAVKLRDGTVYFVQPPELVAATTTFNSVNEWGATYYFTITLPEEAGEPLQRVTIKQQEGADNIRYRLKKSRAFEGTRHDKGTPIKLAEVTNDRDNRLIVVNFEQPIPPGKTITIGLQPVENPFSPGVYLFGVTAFPTGEKSHGQFIGYGRLQFYSDRGLN